MIVGGLVLCGGESSRMGRPKAWLPVGHEVMLQRVVRIVGEVFSPVIVVAAPGQDLPQLPASVEIVCDEHPGRGPLQGLVTGLQTLSGHVNAAFATACDAPFLQTPFLQKLETSLASSIKEPWPGMTGAMLHAPCSELEKSLLAAVPRISERLHPLAAIYSLEVLPVLERELAAGRLRLTDLFSRFPVRFLSEFDFQDVDPNLDSLRNVNTPEEYAQVLRELLN